MTTRWNFIETIWKDNRWLFALSGWLLGMVTITALQQVNVDILALFHDLVPETVGIVFTVLILERFAENRADQERKLTLFRQVISRSNDVALEAVDQILHDGLWDALLEHYRNNNGMVILPYVQWAGGVDLNNVDLSRSNLVSANLQSADLRQSDLYKTILMFSNLSRTRLWGANLEGSHLGVANLQQSMLDEANLQYAFLEGASLQGARLQRANLKHAALGGINLRQANLYQAQLANAKNIETVHFDEKTVLPDAKNSGSLTDPIYDKYWTSKTDMTRYTDPSHPDFWQPPYLKRDYKGHRPPWVTDDMLTD